MAINEIFTLLGKEFSPIKRRRLVNVINDYTSTMNRYLKNSDPIYARDFILSEFNYLERHELKSCRSMGMTISEGDICYIDFGPAYQLETGFQHFGLVIKVFDAKVLVIPMTSNPEAYRDAYDSESNPEGLQHLMRFGKQKGCYRYSVLFLNDIKFINTARVINIKGNILREPIYKKIKERLANHLHLVDEK